VKDLIIQNMGCIGSKNREFVVSTKMSGKDMGSIITVNELSIDISSVEDRECDYNKEDDEDNEREVEDEEMINTIRGHRPTFEQQPGLFLINESILISNLVTHHNRQRTSVEQEQEQREQNTPNLLFDNEDLLFVPR
jgi:hypothetical protein